LKKNFEKTFFTNFRKTWKKPKQTFEELQKTSEKEFENHFENFPFFENLEKLEIFIQNIWKTFEKNFCKTKNFLKDKRNFWKNSKNFRQSFQKLTIFRTFSRQSVSRFEKCSKNVQKKFLKMFFKIILDVSFSKVINPQTQNLNYLEKWCRPFFNFIKCIHFLHVLFTV
jgi:hypothetical protein